MESKRLDNAALAAGISPNYINAHGKPQSIGAETKRRLLDAMHRTTAATQVAVTPVPNVMVYTAGKKMPLAVEGSGEFNWLLTTEEGVQHKGHAVGGKSFNLPAKLPEGYHTLISINEISVTIPRKNSGSTSAVSTARLPFLIFPRKEVQKDTFTEETSPICSFAFVRKYFRLFWGNKRS